MAKYKHALCLNPYLKESSAAMGFFPPIGLEYIAAALQHQVPKVSLIDLRKDRTYRDPAKLNRFIRENVDLICVSINWSYCFNDVCRVINELPSGIDLVVGGQEATNNVETVFEKVPHLNVIVRGEGEATIQQIAQGANYPDIPGISYRNNGQIIHNANRAPSDVNTISNPNRSLRLSPYYISAENISLGMMFDTVLSARGCPFNCTFCTMALGPLGQKRPYSARSPESVVEEIRSIQSDIIFFADDNFFVNPKRVEKICDLLIAQGVKKRYAAQARIEIYKHPQLLEKAVKAGIKWLLIGIESPHDRILQQINKGFTSAEVRKAFEVLKDYPFYYHCYFIYGNIDETRDEMLYIPVFAKEIGADSISFQKLQVRPHSLMLDMVKSRPDLHIDNSGFVYSDRYSMRDLRAIQKLIRKSFYTPRQVHRIMRKAVGLKMFESTEILGALVRLPFVIPELVAKKIGGRRKHTPRPAPGHSPIARGDIA
jgi:anaerobic magnesium-protoporphyrin IX monomethyl ester cyclase